MRHELDPILDAFMGDLEIPDDTQGEDDAILKFIEQGSLAAVIGHANVEKLNAETEIIDERVRKSAAPARSEWEQPLTDDAHRLEKRYTAGIHSGKKAARIEKSANGQWVMEYDSDGELIRGYVNEAA